MTKDGVENRGLEIVNEMINEAGDDRTNVELTVSGPFLVGLRRSLPRNALNRLHALCQTAAEL